MTDGFFNGLAVTDVHGDYCRNIATIRVSQDLYDDLTDSAAGWQAAADLEMATKPPPYTFDRSIINRPFEEAAYIEAIDFPFKNWAKTRYSDGTYGVWYGSDSLETSVHETVYHWRQGFLTDAGWQDIEEVAVERKLYLVRCDAALLDFRPKIVEFPGLIDPVSYHFTQPIGARLHHDGHPGLLTQSARCPGEMMAVFNPRVLSNPRPHCFLTYRVSGGRTVVERQPGEVILRL
jgi:hypothetical protein